MILWQPRDGQLTAYTELCGVWSWGAVQTSFQFQAWQWTLGSPTHILKRSISFLGGFPGGSVAKGSSLVAQWQRGLLWWLSSKESACNVGNPHSIPGVGRSPGGGNGHPLQYSCLENPMDRGAWWATVHGVEKSWLQLSNWHTSFLHQRKCYLPWPGSPDNLSHSQLSSDNLPNKQKSFFPASSHVPGLAQPDRESPAQPTRSWAALRASPCGSSGHPSGTVWKSHCGGNARHKAPCHVVRGTLSRRDGATLSCNLSSVSKQLGPAGFVIWTVINPTSWIPCPSGLYTNHATRPCTSPCLVRAQHSCSCHLEASGATHVY